MEHKELYKIRDFINGLNKGLLLNRSDRGIKDMVSGMDFQPCEKELSSNILKPDDDSLDGYLILIKQIRNKVEKTIDQSFISSDMSISKIKLETLIQVLNDAIDLKPRKITNENFDNVAISINSDIIDKLYAKLKTYFPGGEKDLENVLKGKSISEPLLFPHNQNKFVEVFRRLKYNGYLPNASTEIKDWICANFNRRKDENTISFNPSTVWDILTKAKGEPAKKERICIADWLPYKSLSQLQNEAKKEKL